MHTGPNLKPRQESNCHTKKLVMHSLGNRRHSLLMPDVPDVVLMFLNHVHATQLQGYLQSCSR